MASILHLHSKTGALLVSTQFNSTKALFPTVLCVDGVKCRRQFFVDDDADAVKIFFD